MWRAEFHHRVSDGIVMRYVCNYFASGEHRIMYGFVGVSCRGTSQVKFSVTIPVVESRLVWTNGKPVTANHRILQDLRV